VPYRHLRDKVTLLTDGLLLNPDGEVLLRVLLKVAEKRPEDVLDAVIAVMDDNG
jgi:hypothetical protein